jgi:serine/threonine-protein kinase
MPMDPERLTVTEPPVAVLPGITAIPNSGRASLDVSRNGTVVFVKGTGVEQATLQLVDRTGRTTQVGRTGGLFSNVRVSPDGKRLIFFMGPTDQRDLWVQNLERDTATKLTFDGKSGPSGVWSPDGKHVMYMRQGKAWWIRSDGGGQPQMIMDEAGPESISPDGKRLLFSRLLPSGSELFTAAIEESGDLLEVGQPKPFFTTTPRDSSAEISPDGRWVAYQATEVGGRSELFVRPFSDAGGKWQVSSNGGSMPAWSRSELLYVDGSGRLMAVPYTANGDAFVAGTERMWWDGQIRVANAGRNYDVTRDGKRTVVVQDASAASGAKTPGQITVLLNFYDELLRKIPPK